MGWHLTYTFFFLIPTVTDNKMVSMRQKQPWATYFMDLNWCMVPYHTNICWFCPSDFSLQCTTVSWQSHEHFL